MTTVTVGSETLHLTFDDQFRVLAAETLAQSAVLQWLCRWLPGRELRVAQEVAGEEMLLAHPQWGLAEARLVDAFLKDALYRTHLKVQVTGQMVCDCRQVTRETIHQSLSTATTREEVTQLTQAGAGCGTCHPEIEKMLLDVKPKSKRWQGEANSHWVLTLQDSLTRYQQHNTHYPHLTVDSFLDGIVRVKVKGELTADQEWDLINGLTNYWADGFPAGLAVFLDFSLAQASK